MAKKLIQACAVLILVTAIIYGNKPIQQGQPSRLTGAAFHQTTAYYQGRGTGTPGGGGGLSGAFRNI